MIFFSGWQTCYAIEPLLKKGNFNCVDSGGNCDVSDFLKVGIRVSNIILGLTGSLSLLMFVAGGFMMLLSSGNKEMVEKGKKTLIGAVIGLVIVFSSYLIIKYVTEGLGGQFNGETPASSGSSYSIDENAYTPSPGSSSYDENSSYLE